MGKDKKVQRISGGKISFSTSNLEYIKAIYPVEFQSFKDECLGISGIHGQTRLYSVVGVIESDHTIPHDVWKSTTNPKMQAICMKGGAGRRIGEDFMPAITIPYNLHRNLLTTGSGADREKFRKDLVDLCNKGKIDEALIKCYKEYKRNGMNTGTGCYRTAIEKSLDEHVALGLITMAQKTTIIGRL